MGERSGSSESSGGGYDPPRTPSSTSPDGGSRDRTDRDEGTNDETPTDDRAPTDDLPRSALFDALPDPVVVTDADADRIIAVNDATVELLGRDRTDLVGSHASTLYPPSESERYRSLVREAVESEGTNATQVDGNGEFHVVDGGGGVTPVEVSARRVVVDDHVCVLETFRDVSDRNHRERVLEELHDATGRLMRADTTEAIAEIISEVADGVLGLPLHSVMLYDESEDVLEQAAVSAAAAEAYGDVWTVERGEAMVWKVFEAGEPRVYGDVREDPDVYNPDTEIRAEFVIPIGEFGVFMASSTAVDDFDPADVALGKVLAANAEVALDRLERERRLREQTRKLRTIIDNAPVILFALDGDGTFTLSEGKGLDGIGLEPGEVVGQSVFDLYEDSDDILEDIDRALDGEKVSPTHKIGNQVYETWFQPVESGGEVTDVIGVSIEVTERERRERLVRVLNRFLRHNLRNAMNVMVGYAERLDGHEDPQVQRAIDQISQAGDDLTRLSEKARRLGQMAGTEGESDVVDVRSSIDQIVESLEASHDATFEYDGADGETVLVDETIELALREICENAVKHANRTSPRAEVSVRHREPDGQVVVDVTDEGPGMPPQERAVLNSEGETPLNHGSGLGLFVAYWAITDIGGEINVRSADDGGTVVSIQIPTESDAD